MHFPEWYWSIVFLYSTWYEDHTSFLKWIESILSSFFWKRLCKTGVISSVNIWKNSPVKRLWAWKIFFFWALNYKFNFLNSYWNIWIIYFILCFGISCFSSIWSISSVRHMYVKLFTVFLYCPVSAMISLFNSWYW